MTHDFHHTKLRGKDFRGKNFTGANFSGTDIRGVDFSNAILIDANFNNSKAGLPISKIITFIILLLFLSFIAGLLTGDNAAFIINSFVSSSSEANLFAILVLIALLTFFYYFFTMA